MKKISQKATVKPKNEEELKALIEAEIKKFGAQCDLNHIDVSLITDFSWLFHNSKFNGDISQWDVSSVMHMDGMFLKSRFNGDISKWDVSGVVNMDCMFFESIFNGDISRWDVSSCLRMSEMFYGSKFNFDVSEWNISLKSRCKCMFFRSTLSKLLGIENPSFCQVKSHFLNLKLEADLQAISPGQIQASKVRL